ncbi:MAG: tRNA-binding protein [Gammaproteobacteria bacterium]|nr:tRNA-binding protein [Gammaproteobacteria bacterium]
MTNGFEAFQGCDIRVGTVVEVQSFPEARKPALKVWVDFGELGVKKTSAQITDRYTAEGLVGRQVFGLLNVDPRQVGPLMSEFLLLGAHNAEGEVQLAQPDGHIQNGAKLA